MKKIFKIFVLIFSSTFFIVGCGGGSVPADSNNINASSNVQISMRFPAPGSHYGYVAGYNDPVITSYTINANGDFTNPKTTVLEGLRGSINGIAISPDHKYLYFSYLSSIGKCALNNDGSVNSHCDYYSLHSNGIANFLAVDPVYDRLYVTDQINLNVYVCKIDSTDDSLDCNYALQIPQGTYDREQGIAFSPYSNLVYIAYQNIYSKYTIKSCPTNLRNGSIDASQCTNYNSSTITELVGGIAFNLGAPLLYAADMQQNNLIISCSLDPRPLEIVNSCDYVQDRTRNGLYRTFDVAVSFNGGYVYITTSQHAVLKFFRHNNGVDVFEVMPATQGRPSYSITTF